MKREKLLIQGEVPASTVCPFLSECAMHGTKLNCRCGNTERDTSISCGSARAFDIVNSRTESMKESMSQFANKSDLFEARSKRLEAEVIQLREACQAMLDCTGGSAHWNGETHKALLLIEQAMEATK